jgi:hypothetical protein
MPDQPTETPVDAPEAPVPATGEPNGSPVPNGTPEPENEPETFDRDYVVGLRDEAAQHRVRAREAETERDRLRERLIEDNVRHLAAGTLADPADLIHFGDPDALVDEDGLPDPDRIVAAARDLVRNRPHLASRRPTGTVEQGARDEPAGVDLAGMLRTRAG